MTTARQNSCRRCWWGVFYKNNIKSVERQIYAGLGRLVQTQTALVEVEGSRNKDLATTSAYDADGQRVITTYPDGTIVYTPFPDYEVTDPPGSGANTVRTTYRLAGQIVAVRRKWVR